MMSDCCGAEPSRLSDELCGDCLEHAEFDSDGWRSFEVEDTMTIDIRKLRYELLLLRKKNQLLKEKGKLLKEKAKLLKEKIYEQVHDIQCR